MVDSVRQIGNGRAWGWLALSLIGVLVPVSVVSFPAALCLVLWLPGRAMVRLLPEVWAARGCVASALAAAVLFVPLPLTCVWAWTNDRFILIGCLAVFNAALLLLSRNASTSCPVMFPSGRLRFAFLLLLTYVGALTFCVFWVPAAGGRVAQSPSMDYIKHHAVLFSLDHHPLPLHNIFYAAEKDTPYYYYHYQYLVPATLRILTGRQVSIAFAYGIFAGLTAVLLISMVCLISLSVMNSPAGALLSGCLVSIVGGFAIVPALIQVYHGRPMFIGLDSWVSFPWRIHNVGDFFMWCPQHVAASMTFMACCYWLLLAPRASWWLLAGPLAAASIFGSSVYQAMVVFVAVGIYLVVEIFRARGSLSVNERASGPVGEGARQAQIRKFVLGAFGIVIALALIIPQAIGYAEMSHRYPGRGLTMQWDRFEFAFFGRRVPPGVLANFLDAWWVVAIHLGLPLLAFLFIQHPLRRLCRPPGTRLLFICGLTGLVTTFIVRSAVTVHDLAFLTSVMPFTCAAAVLAGGLLEPNCIRPVLRSLRVPLLIVGIGLGSAVGLYEMPAMAIRTLVEKSKFVPAEKKTLLYLRDQTPPDSIVQGDPIERVFLPQMIHRQMGVVDPENAHVLVLRPRDSAKMQAATVDIESVFSSKSAAEAFHKLHAWGVTHVLAGDAERKRFGEMTQFHDPRFFEDVYKDNGSAVYRLKSVENEGRK